LALVVRDHLTQLHAVQMVLILLLLLDVRPTHQLVVEVEEILMHQVVDQEEQVALEVVLENQKIVEMLHLLAQWLVDLQLLAKETLEEILQKVYKMQEPVVEVKVL
tara:strand:- start:242 stop:559 length:318 start_codon:yes stop_codon:yes gene_type:complete